MTVTEILQSVQFIVGQEGKPTAVVLDIQTWGILLSMLEDVEDVQLIRDRLNNWQTKRGWMSWEEFEAEIDAPAGPRQKRLVYGQFAGENMSTLENFAVAEWRPTDTELDRE